MQQKFYSNGKLLLTGEYLVLDGALALAVPTKFGQDMIVEPGGGREIQWKSVDHDGSVWFSGRIGLAEIENPSPPEHSIRATLINILHEAYKLNPALVAGEGYKITTHLSFPRYWGLGTSSTLINNIASWQNIDPFKLLHNSFGGSGYDIACAHHCSALLYQLKDHEPVVTEVKFDPPFADKLYFVYLNRKQSSKAAIAAYHNNSRQGLHESIREANRITQTILATDNPGVFARALEHHESLLSAILEMKTVGEAFFQDFDGVTKSLGGWGGDFILAMAQQDPTEYFKSKGFPTVIRFRDMVLQNRN